MHFVKIVKPNGAAIIKLNASAFHEEKNTLWNILYDATYIIGELKKK